jgi:aspartyl-tRNA synthetase
MPRRPALVIGPNEAATPAGWAAKARWYRECPFLRQAKEKGLSSEPIGDYLKCFRFGCPPHGGFGLGLGRLLMAMLGLESIRDATFLFRGPTRLTP